MSMYILVGPCVDDRGFWIRMEIKNSDSGHGVVEMSTSDARRFIQQMELVLQTVDANIAVHLKENSPPSQPDNTFMQFCNQFKD